MYTVNRFDGTANDTNVTDVTSAAIKDLTGSFTASDRHAVMVTNNSTTATLYIKVKSGTTEPTLTATNYHFKLAPGTEKTIQAGKAVKVWAINDTSPSANSIVTVVELR